MSEIWNQRNQATNVETSVIAVDEPEFGAHHIYRINVFGRPQFGNSESLQAAFKGQIDHHYELHFQKGPILERGINGIPDIALIMILIDRLRGFQNTPFWCAENEGALAGLEAAAQMLTARTANRVTRGVEGTNKV